MFKINIKHYNCPVKWKNIIIIVAINNNDNKAKLLFKNQNNKYL